jgi:hypothetical protein
MWKFKRMQDDKADAFNDRWHQLRTFMAFYKNMNTPMQYPRSNPEDFIHLPGDSVKTDTMVNLHDNPQLLEEFKKRFKVKPRKRG